MYGYTLYNIYTFFVIQFACFPFSRRTLWDNTNGSCDKDHTVSIHKLKQHNLCMMFKRKYRVSAQTYSHTHTHAHTHRFCHCYWLLVLHFMMIHYWNTVQWSVGIASSVRIEFQQLFHWYLYLTIRIWCAYVRTVYKYTS